MIVIDTGEDKPDETNVYSRLNTMGHKATVPGKDGMVIESLTIPAKGNPSGNRCPEPKCERFFELPGRFVPVIFFQAEEIGLFRGAGMG